MNLKNIILTAKVLVGVISTTVHASTIELNFDSLPTNQGWSYQGQIPETSAASVDGTKLTINTLNQGVVSAWFFMPDIVNPNLPFTLSVRARVPQSETPFGPFDFQVRHGLELWSADLGPNSIQLPSQTTIPIDGTKFHDFLIDATPGIKSDFYIDGRLVESTSPFIGNVDTNLIAFGDGNAVNSDANGLIEISRFRFVQAVPIPVAAWLMLSGLAVLGGVSSLRTRYSTSN